MVVFVFGQIICIAISSAMEFKSGSVLTAEPLLYQRLPLMQLGQGCRILIVGDETNRQQNKPAGSQNDIVRKVFHQGAEDQHRQWYGDVADR